ncbi:MAG: hypothetical protein AB7H92_08330 [Microbacteriaceae bacterium]
MFGLNAVTFHLGRGPAPARRTSHVSRQFDWPSLTERTPVLTATMRRYLDRLAISLRPGSVAAIDTTMRLRWARRRP